ncbi:unnamed protein product [Prorocentrum cordatum]|nr:unnamed protein product [Polarella glacialis]
MFQAGNLRFPLPRGRPVHRPRREESPTGRPRRPGPARAPPSPSILDVSSSVVEPARPPTTLPPALHRAHASPWRPSSRGPRAGAAWPPARQPLAASDTPRLARARSCSQPDAEEVLLGRQAAGPRRRDARGLGRRLAVLQEAPVQERVQARRGDGGRRGLSGRTRCRVRRRWGRRGRRGSRPLAVLELAGLDALLLGGGLGQGPVAVPVQLLRACVARLPHARDLVGAPEVGAAAALHLGDVGAHCPVHVGASHAEEHAQADARPACVCGGALCTPRVFIQLPQGLQHLVVLLVEALDHVFGVLFPQLASPHLSRRHGWCGWDEGDA